MQQAGTGIYTGIYFFNYINVLQNLKGGITLLSQRNYRNYGLFKK